MAVLPEVGLFRSDDLAEVLSVIDEMNVPYAGATELIPAMRLGVRRPEVLVDLKRVDAIRGVRVDTEAQTVWIGAATTHQTVAGSPEVREHVPSLAGAASRVGNARVRSSGRSSAANQGLRFSQAVLRQLGCGRGRNPGAQSAQARTVSVSVACRRLPR